MRETLLNMLEQRGLSQGELAEMSGVPPATISEILTGKTERPRNKTLRALADALKIDVKELQEGKKPPVVSDTTKRVIEVMESLSEPEQLRALAALLDRKKELEEK